MKIIHIIFSVAIISSAAQAQPPQISSQALAQAVSACASVVGISMPDPNNKATWRIDYSPGVTGPCQTAAQAAVTAFTYVSALNVIPFPTFISRWTNPEYAALMQARATAIAAGNVVLIQQWDQVATAGQVDLNATAVATFKAALVSTGILTQARADVIFN
jgi:hypothetical protein